MNKLCAFILTLVAPRKCGGCGAIFDPFGESANDALCPHCRLGWEQRKIASCGKCKKANADCICRVRFITSRSTKVLTLTKFGGGGSTDSFIYKLKHKNDNRYFEFASSELYKRLLYESNLMVADYSSAVFTNVPRSRRAVAEYGYDHAEILAKGVAERMKGEYRPLLVRAKSKKQQKKLTPEERKENVKDSFIFGEDKKLNGATVVLVDDVVTTGATAAECIRVLRRNGAGEIIVLALARAKPL